MENQGSWHALGATSAADASRSPDFAAVLQEIFQQAKTEIDARDRNLSSRYVSLHVDRPQVLPQDNTYGQDPLVDPALSFISDILAEDDESHFSHPVEFYAYQAKAFEMAALLKEDSPSLALQIQGGAPAPTEDLGSPLELPTDAVNSGYVSYHEADLPTSFRGFSEPFRNELLLNSLRGPVSRSDNVPCYSQLQLQLPEIGTSGEELLHVPLGQVGNGQLNAVALMDAMGSGQSTRLLKTEAHLDGHMNMLGLANIDPGNGKLHSHVQAGSQDDANAKLQTQKSPRTGQGLKARRRGSSSSLKKSAGKAKSNKDTDKECVELNDLLIQCSQAVGLNNTKRALEILKKVKQHASPYGNGAERHAHYFAEAMEARFSGTGWPRYMGLLGRHPSSAEILRATYMYMASCPFVEAYHYFINQSILNVARGATKLHILELQVDGFQYPALFKDLASLPGGPPQVHLIGLGFPHYSMLPAQTDVVLEAVEKTGRKLSGYAASYGIPFEYTPWAGVRENLRMQDFVTPHRPAGEVLVVISASLLRYVMDDTLDSPIVRSKLLKQGRDINPEVYIQGIITGSYSTPFFTRRFREALFHFESVFDMLDTFIERENTDRLVFEGEILGKAILNVIACEGTEVVDRIDKYKHWQAVTEEVGFKQLPLDKGIKDHVQHKLKTRHKEYTVSEDSQYLLMGWKGRMLHAMSTWNACAEDSI